MLCLKQGNAHHKLITIKVLSWTDAALYYTVRYLVLYINLGKEGAYMARERPNYRDTLEVQLDIVRQSFPGQNFLSKDDVRKFMHWGWEKVNKHFKFIITHVPINAG